MEVPMDDKQLPSGNADPASTDNRIESLYSSLVAAGYSDQIASVTVRSFEAFLSEAGYVSQLQGVLSGFDTITKLMYGTLDQTLKLILVGTVARLEESVDGGVLTQLNETRQQLREALATLKH